MQVLSVQGNLQSLKKNSLPDPAGCLHFQNVRLLKNHLHIIGSTVTSQVSEIDPTRQVRDVEADPVKAGY